MAQQFSKERSITIGPGRISFPYLFTPRQQMGMNNQPAGVPKYECTLLLPPTTNLDPLYRALWAAASDRWGSDNTKWPMKVRDVRAFVRKCDSVQSLAQHAGWYFVSAKSQEPVGIIDTNRLDVKDQAAVYAGRWGWLSIAAFAFQQPTNLGLSWGLNGVMVGRHDEKFGGRADAKTQFADVVPDPGMEAGPESGPPVAQGGPQTPPWEPQGVPTGASAGSVPAQPRPYTPQGAPQPAPAAWVPPKPRPDLSGAF